MAHKFHRDDATFNQVDYSDISNTPSSTTLVAATQSDMESATSSTVYASPATAQFHPSAAKAWVKLSSGTVVASNNISSVTSTGTGTFDITFTNAFSSSNYAYALTAMGNNSNAAFAFGPFSVNPTSTKFGVFTTNILFAATNCSYVSAIFYGDLA